MSDESRVYLKKEGRIYRWGESAYFKSCSGLKETLSISGLKRLGFPLAILFAVAMFFSAKESARYGGAEIPAPSVTSGEAGISVPIHEARERQAYTGSARNRSENFGRIRVLSLQGSLEIPVGTEARAVLESGATDGIVKAKLAGALEMDGEPVIPAGAILVGRGKSSEERLYVEFKRAVLANGQAVTIRGQAFDHGDKILGLKGSAVGRRSKKMAMAVGFGVLGGATDALQDTSGSSFFGQPKRSVRDAALAGASKAALDQSEAYLDEMKNARPVIEVKSGTEFFLIIDEPRKED